MTATYSLSTWFAGLRGTNLRGLIGGGREWFGTSEPRIVALALSLPDDASALPFASAPGGLPNFDESKFYYFRAVEFGKEAPGAMLDFDTPVKADSKDDVLEYHYGWRCSELVHKGLMQGFGSISLASTAVAVTTLLAM